MSSADEPLDLKSPILRARDVIDDGFERRTDFSDFPKRREDRVRFVMMLMAVGEFITGKTGEDISASAGISLHTIRDICAEASRRCKSAVDVPLVRQHLAVVMQSVIGHGERLCGPHFEYDAEGGIVEVGGDPKAVAATAAAVKAYAGLIGAGAASKVEVTGKDGVPLGLPADHPLLALGRPPTVDELESYAKGDEDKH